MISKSNIGSGLKIRLTDGDIVTAPSFGMVRSTGGESKGSSRRVVRSPPAPSRAGRPRNGTENVRGRVFRAAGALGAYSTEPGSCVFGRSPRAHPADSAVFSDSKRRPPRAIRRAERLRSATSAPFRKPDVKAASKTTTMVPRDVGHDGPQPNPMKFHTKL